MCIKWSQALGKSIVLREDDLTTLPSSPLLIAGVLMLNHTSPLRPDLQVPREDSAITLSILLFFKVLFLHFASLYFHYFFFLSHFFLWQTKSQQELWLLSPPEKWKKYPITGIQYLNLLLRKTVDIAASLLGPGGEKQWDSLFHTPTESPPYLTLWGQLTLVTTAWCKECKNPELARRCDPYPQLGQILESGHQIPSHLWSPLSPERRDLSLTVVTRWKPLVGGGSLLAEPSRGLWERYITSKFAFAIPLTTSRVSMRNGNDRSRLVASFFWIFISLRVTGLYSHLHQAFAVRPPFL